MDRLLLAAVALAIAWFFESRRRRRGRPPPRDVAALVAALYEPATLLRPRSDRAPASFLGGRPPACPGWTWPRGADGRPLTFLGGVGLSEVEGTPWLPRAGWLLFFYDVVEQPWGFRPEHRHGWAVRYVADPSSCTGEKAPPGEAAPPELPRRPVRLERVDLPPLPEGDAIEVLALTDEEADALLALRDAAFGDHPHHQIGGRPDPIQDSGMELECQLASNGLDVGGPEGYRDPRADALRSGAADWRLLLQLDSDRELGVMWGDLGMLYFWVREEDARRAHFDDVWVVLQCT